MGSCGQTDSFGARNQSAGILQVLWVGDKRHHLLFGLYIFRYDAFNLFVRLWGQVAAGYFRAGAFFGELLCVIILVFFLAN